MLSLFLNLQIFPRLRPGWALPVIPCRYILISPVTQTWLLALVECSVFISWRILIIRISPAPSRSSGAGGISLCQTGFVITCISRLAGIGGAVTGPLLIWLSSFSSAGCGMGPAGTLSSGACSMDVFWWRSGAGSAMSFELFPAGSNMVMSCWSL